MFRSLGPPEIILILVVLVLLFGAKRLPDAARSLGRSMRIFKSEVKEMGKDGEEQKPEPIAPREVEGRVVDPEPVQRAAAPSEHAEHAERDR